MISTSDLEKWQQAINGITTAQSELSPEELSAFSAIISLLHNGNFEASESDDYIRVFKNALPQHAKNRLLQVHLKNFITLCEKYFKTQAATPTNTPSNNSNATQKPNTGGRAKSSGNSSMQVIIVIGIILVVGYFFVKDSDWFNNLFEEEQEEIEQIAVEEEVENTNQNLTIKEIQVVVEEAETIETPQQDIQLNTQNQNLNTAIPGRFPQASERFLTNVDLQNLNKNDLKIMRNEIYARHGYIFQTNEMKSYFKYQDWYIPKHNNVNSMLTDIEMKNIELIKHYE